MTRAASSSIESKSPRFSPTSRPCSTILSARWTSGTIRSVASIGSPRSARDTLFVFEIDENSQSSLLLADGELGSSMSQRLVFLESGRLCYSDGGNLVWLFEGSDLENREQLVLDQPDIRSIAVATGGDGWASYGGTDGAGWILSYGSGMGAGFASPGTTTCFPHASLMAMNDTHLYAGIRREDLVSSSTEWYYVFERGDSLALTDSIATPFRTNHQYAPWTIERGFLLTANPVFDLADPAHPTLLGTFIDPELSVYHPLIDVAARPFFGSDTDLLAAVQIYVYADTLAFYRVSRERIYDEVHELGAHYAFDDTRDLFYRAVFDDDTPIWVHDISDPYHPEPIYSFQFSDGDPSPRFTTELTVHEGVLHVGARSGQLGYNSRGMITPLWFDGERFVPAGKPLHTGLNLMHAHNRAGYFAATWDGAALLSFDPPPLPRRVEHPADGR